MRLYNTVTRQLEDLKPLQAGEVTLYTCGPTVYDYAHIGNLRAFVFDDTLRRALEASNHRVRHVMNITDVGHLVADEDESILSEDKFEKGARREGKTVWDVAAHYTEAFKDDMKVLNILPPNTYHSPTGDTYARATEFINQQISLVQTLLDKGLVYQTQQALYFDISRLDDYGKLTGQNLKDKEVGVRTEVVTDPDKHHPHDFAVWFFTIGHFKDHSMRWQSPWGEGFPGWHLECSAIIHATLGDPIDIHTGGVDHIGTHHTNEIAQTEGAFGHPLANIWMHNEHLLVDGGKMSKSKNNFYTLKDTTNRGYHPLALRLLFLQAHYRTQQNFTWESLQAAQNTLLNLYAWADLKYQNLGPKVGFPKSKAEAIKQAIENDLSTPVVLSSIAQIADLTPEGLDQESADEFFKYLDQILGLDLSNRLDITPAQKHLIADREAARTTKDWARADRLRGQLRDQQLEIDDTPAGPRWRRTNIS